MDSTIKKNCLNDEELLQAVNNALAESVAETSDAEILMELREAGESPADAAERVRLLLRNTAKTFRQRRLYESWEEYRRQSAALSQSTFPLPDSPEARRELLASVFTRYPQMQTAFLTIQHRDFKALADSDVESILRQLSQLGVLDVLQGSHLAEEDPEDA
jgi:hypothetical protein